MTAPGRVRHTDHAMDRHFGCTQCGLCCRDLKLPLGLDEAIAWTAAGHAVELLVEAIPEAVEPDSGTARFDRARSMPMVSGSMAMRVAIMPVAWHDGPCPWLDTAMRCSRYETRPRVCRIYPLIARDTDAPDPAQRLCPPEAWDPAQPLLTRGAVPADPALARTMAAYRRTAADDIAALIAVCALLGWSRAGFANEGFATMATDPARLNAAMASARRDPGAVAPVRNWTIATNRRSTLALLQSAGCAAEMADPQSGYRGVFAPEA